jgi:hypothetical protein
MKKTESIENKDQSLVGLIWKEFGFRYGGLGTARRRVDRGPSFQLDLCSRSRFGSDRFEGRLMVLFNDLVHPSVFFCDEISRMQVLGRAD